MTSEFESQSPRETLIYASADMDQADAAMGEMFKALGFGAVHQIYSSLDEAAEVTFNWGELPHFLEGMHDDPSQGISPETMKVLAYFGLKQTQLILLRAATELYDERSKDAPAE